MDLGIPGLTGFEEIGSGGFASVYAAEEPEAGRTVAVKVLRAADEAARRRFDRERHTLGRTTDHPNIVTMFRSGFTERGDHPYLVMEYMAGGSLDARLAGHTRLTVPHSIELVTQIADALGFAHGAGILHKDVKPANVLLSSGGTAKLSDFGIAAMRDATGTSQMGFSLAYASPETFDAESGADGRFVDRRDERSDLYSLAATLYALVVGSPPFASETQATAMHRILTEQPRPTGLAGLDRFFARALAKDRRDRFPTAQRFIEGLDAAATDLLGEEAATVQPDSAIVGSMLGPTGSSAGTQPFAPRATDGGYATGPVHTPSGSSGANRATATGLHQRPGRATRRRSIAALIGTAAVAAVAAGFAANAYGILPGAETDVAEEAEGTTERQDGGESASAIEPVAGSDSGSEAGSGSTIPTVDTTEPDAALLVDGARAGDENATSVGPSSTVTGSTATTDGSVTETSTTEAAPAAPAARATTTAPAPDTGPVPAADPTAIAVLGPGDRTNNVVELANGRFASFHFETGVRIWDRSNPQATIAAYTGHPNGVGSMVELGNGLIASGGSFGDGTVHVWDPANPGTSIAVYSGHRADGAVTAIDVLDNGRIVSGDAVGSVHIWDPADPGTTIATYDGHPSVIITQILQLRNGLVLSNGEGSGAHVWSPNNPGAGASVHQVPGSDPGRTYTYEVAETDTGLIAAGTTDGTIHVWRGGGSSPIGAFTDHIGNIGAVLALDDGLIASGGHDGLVHIWDSADPSRKLATYSGHTGPVFSLARLGNGHIASTASNQVHIWDPYGSSG